MSFGLSQKLTLHLLLIQKLLETASLWLQANWMGEKISQPNIFYLYKTHLCNAIFRKNVTFLSTFLLWLKLFASPLFVPPVSTPIDLHICELYHTVIHIANLKNVCTLLKIGLWSYLSWNFSLILLHNLPSKDLSKWPLFSTHVSNISQVISF